MRLQGRFLIEAAKQIEEMVQLLQHEVDEATLEAITMNLDRLISSAASLQLSALAAGITLSRDKLEYAVSPLSLHSASEALRTAGYYVAFPPIAVVGDATVQEALLGQHDAHCEQLLFFENLEAYRRQVLPSGFQAVVVPHAELKEVVLLPRGTPRIVYGGSGDEGFPQQTIQHSVEGLLSAPLVRSDLLRMVRNITWQSTWLRPRAILLLQDEELRRRLARLMTFKGVHVLSTSHPPSFYELLGQNTAEILVVDGDPTGMDLVRWVRSSRPHCHTNAVFIGDLADAFVFARAGGNKTLSSEQDPEQLANYLSHRAHSPTCPVSTSGLPGRPEILNRLDEELDRSRRSQDPVIAALLELEFPDRELAREEVLPAAAQVLRAEVRRSDLLGHLGRDTFLLALLNTPHREGAERLRALQRRLEQAMEGRSLNSNVTFCAGYASTAHGLPDVIQRADRALRAARASRDRQRIELG
ncbi:MAG: diguanylate cyclase [Deltaproteobacteria bacterium]|nr:diguanylate cyclase [Deltaproteobacteria bacterium]